MSEINCTCDPRIGRVCIKCRMRETVRIDDVAAELSRLREVIAEKDMLLGKWADKCREQTFRRVWAMPNAYTFAIKPIREFVVGHLGAGVWVDPFAGFNSPCGETNDLNPIAPTKYHEDARDFLKRFTTIDGLVFDPPYSPRQISEHYKALGIAASREDTQHAKLVAECKDLAAERMPPGAKAICCSWNSTGMGKSRGFELIEVLIVNHGASHNDTIVTVEVKR